MILVQLWKHGLLLSQETVENERAAKQLIDWLLSSVHNGHFGTGRYKIDADHVDHRGLFAGAFHRQPWFAYPVGRVAA